jgi:DNA sulfur modification protein DndC
MKSFYEPTAEHLTKLAVPWCCSYSGGKDSTSLVTWIEWLRRSGRLEVDSPALVQSDTTVEYAALGDIAADLRGLLTASGWTCAVVVPKVSERLYCRILGIGNTPIHPGITSMRWCTRSTKIDPMDRWRREYADGLTLTGLRLGESAMRDGKLKKRGCAAGGECGIPDQSERTYSPLLNWTTCQVIDWLNGHLSSEIAGPMADVFAVTRRLVQIYEVRIDRSGFEFAEPDVQAARFGCIGCPAICAERQAPASVVSRNGPESPLNELYDVWFEARRRQNRLWGKRCDKQFGPIKMGVRKRLFDRVLDIQRRSGVVLITPEDEAFIRQCWANKVYPRGWSEEDEATEPPSETPLFPARPRGAAATA